MVRRLIAADHEREYVVLNPSEAERGIAILSQNNKL